MDRHRHRRALIYSSLAHFLTHASPYPHQLGISNNRDKTELLFSLPSISAIFCMAPSASQLFKAKILKLSLIFFLFLLLHPIYQQSATSKVPPHLNLNTFMYFACSLLVQTTVIFPWITT